MAQTRLRLSDMKFRYGIASKFGYRGMMTGVLASIAKDKEGSYGYTGASAWTKVYEPCCLTLGVSHLLVF
jgi:hypothetical protein